MSANVRYEINLIEGRVLTRRKRAAFFWGMVGYFLACGAIVVVVTYCVVRDLTASRNTRLEVERLENAVRKAYPKQEDAVAGLRMFAEELTREGGRLSSLERALKRRRHAGRILAGLCRQLPRGAYILNFSLDAEEGGVRFDVVLPQSESGGTLDATELLAAWRSDDVLEREVCNLISTISKRQQVNGKASFVLSFSCQLVKRKA